MSCANLLRLFSKSGTMTLHVSHTMIGIWLHYMVRELWIRSATL